MSTLNRNNIKLNWMLAYVGIMKNWLTPNQVLKDINFEYLNKLDSDTLSELYIAAESSPEIF